MKEIQARCGPDSLEFIASSKCTNEESYLMQKLARAVIGTNNVDNCSRYCQSPATKGLTRTVGYGGDSGSISDMERADVIVLVGSNAAENHPVLATRIKRAHKLRGQRLIVADLRQNEMAARADIWLRPKPGTDMIWVSAVAKCILDNGWHDRVFIDARVNNFDKYAESLQPFTLEFAEQRTGIRADNRSMILETFPVGPLACNCTLLGDQPGGEAMVVDPGDNIPQILARLAEHRLTLKQIVVTHGHIDHVGGALRLKRATGAPILLNQNDLPLLKMLDVQAAWLGVATPEVAPPDESADEGLTVGLSAHPARVLHTPGHT
jgi:hypothetical protein